MVSNNNSLKTIVDDYFTEEGFHIYRWSRYFSEIEIKSKHYLDVDIEKFYGTFKQDIKLVYGFNNWQIDKLGRSFKTFQVMEEGEIHRFKFKVSFWGNWYLDNSVGLYTCVIDEEQSRVDGLKDYINLYYTKQ